MDGSKGKKTVIMMVSESRPSSEVIIERNEEVYGNYLSLLIFTVQMFRGRRKFEIKYQN